MKRINWWLGEIAGLCFFGGSIYWACNGIWERECKVDLEERIGLGVSQKWK